MVSEFILWTNFKLQLDWYFSQCRLIMCKRFFRCCCCCCFCRCCCTLSSQSNYMIKVCIWQIACSFKTLLLSQPMRDPINEMRNQLWIEKSQNPLDSLFFSIPLQIVNMICKSKVFRLQNAPETMKYAQREIRGKMNDFKTKQKKWDGLLQKKSCN